MKNVFMKRAPFWFLLNSSSQIYSYLILVFENNCSRHINQLLSKVRRAQKPEERSCVFVHNLICLILISYTCGFGLFKSTVDTVFVVLNKLPF